MTILLSVKQAAIAGRYVRMIALLAILWVTPASVVYAETLRGVALVIGNSNYENLAPLSNPTNDVRAVERLLDSLGFETALSTDRDARRLSRDVRDFIEDAKGADVAIVYYAGHGIEAGGENFLVPIDADLSGLESGDKTFVPISTLIAKLEATVPVVIVMLDACRDNPFPPGTMVQLGDGTEPAPMASAGLAETRGASSLVNPQSRIENLGTVLAFAAEPGKVALDGAPGGNSPYAAAILRHLDAMVAGAEFGTVMRIISEEVYLRTSGRQRPWVNENLRRLLYFGRSSNAARGEEGEILAERRQLLVTIAELPALERIQVERVAQQSKVPMDALYAMLRALGQDAPSDAADLETLLRSQAGRLKDMLAERQTLETTDAEILRLSNLAEQAIGEGALETALRLNERAKARVEELEQTVADAEADIRARRIEFAQVYVKSAEAYTLAFEYLKASEDYQRAFEQVSRWDDDLALYYKRREIGALVLFGEHSGDASALERAVAASREALRMADLLANPDSRAATQHSLGSALLALGSRESDPTRLEEAVDSYLAALEGYTRDRAPTDWARTQMGLGNALLTAGMREQNVVRLEAAVAAYRAALEEYTVEESPLDWANARMNLGIALLDLGMRESGTPRLEEAVEAHREALEKFDRERDRLQWAAGHVNLGNALQELGGRTNGTAQLEQAANAYRAAIEGYDRRLIPMKWAGAHNNLGNTLQIIGKRENSATRLEEAIEAFRSALEEYSPDHTPMDWAMTQGNLGNTLYLLGNLNGSTADLEAAVEAHRAALQAYSRETMPLAWAMRQTNLANVLTSLGIDEGSTDQLKEAVEAYHAALAELPRDQVPLYWARVQTNLAAALWALGRFQNDRKLMEMSVQARRNALLELTREGTPHIWGTTQSDLGSTLLYLGRQTDDPQSVRHLEGAVEAFRNARLIIEREEQPADWAGLSNSMAYAMVLIGERADAMRKFEEAVRILRQALATQRELGAESAFYTADTLCRALLNIGARTQDRNVLLEARTLCESAIAGLGDPEDAPAREEVARNLERVYTALMVLE